MPSSGCNNFCTNKKSVKRTYCYPNCVAHKSVTDAFTFSWTHCGSYCCTISWANGSAYCQSYYSNQNSF